MYAVRTNPKPPPLEEDNYVFFHGMTWKDFEVMLALRGEEAGPRMSYLDGVIELMSPSKTHEYRKKTLARLLELWALETELNLTGFGAWGLKNPVKEAAAEPDECYVLGETAGREVPDLVIEVEWTRKSDRKREIYRRLEVRELWTLQRDFKFVLRVLERGSYVERTKSKILPQLDVAWLTGFVDREPQTAAIRALRDELRKKSRR
jgi:Uma2 family endonuclease